MSQEAVLPELSKLPGSGSNTSLACRALPALAPAPPKIQNEKSSGSGSIVVKSKKSSGKLELWFTNLNILAMTGRGELHFHLAYSQVGQQLLPHPPPTPLILIGRPAWKSSYFQAI